MKTIWTVLLAAVLQGAPVAVRAQFTYTTNNGAITLAGYGGSGGSVVISNFVNIIGNQAFHNCSSLGTVTIPGSVTNLGDDAFSGCTGLANLNIPASVTNVGDGAFSGCTNLSCVFFEGNAPAVGTNVFQNDSNAIAYYVPGTSGWSHTLAGLAAVATTAPAQFNLSSQMGLITITGYTGPGGAVYIPPVINGVPVVSIGSFSTIANVTSLTILPGVAGIDYCAFEYCSLTRVTIPATVTRIGVEAFECCPNILSFYFQGKAPSVGAAAFQECYGIVYYLAGATGWSSNFAGMAAVATMEQSQVLYQTVGGGITMSLYVGAGGSVVIPAAINGLPVTSIGPNAFNDTSVTSVTIPAGVTNIGGDAFINCGSLTAIVVDTNNPVFSSMNGVLFDKSQATLVAFPGGLGGSYTIPGSVTSIGAAAFCCCSNLTSVIIPASLTNIGAYGFIDCGSLTNIYFQGNAPACGFGAFGGGVLGPYDPATIYHLPGTTGWYGTFAGLPAVLWNPLIQTGDGGFGVQNGQFGFNTTGTSGIAIVIEACTNLACPVWVPVQTNTVTSGPCCFSEPLQPGSPGRFYRIRSP